EAPACAARPPRANQSTRPPRANRWGAGRGRRVALNEKLPHEKGFHVSWEQMHRDSRALAWRLDKQGPGQAGAWKAVVAITRGGMVPACIIARELNIRIVDTVSIKSYDHQTQSEARILKEPD